MIVKSITDSEPDITPTILTNKSLFSEGILLKERNNNNKITIRKTPAAPA